MARERADSNGPSGFREHCYVWAYRTYQRMRASLFARLPIPWQRTIERAGFCLKRTVFPHQKMSAIVGPLDAGTESGEQESVRQPGPARWFAPSLPEWAISEMKRLAEIEPQVCPDGSFLEKTRFHFLPLNEAPGKAYGAIRGLIRPGRVTHLVVLPWIKPGGLDLVALRFIAHLAEQPGNRVVAFTTLDAESSWATKLPASVDYVHFGKLVRQLTEAEQRKLFVRLVLQLAPRVLHIINSRVAWSALQFHGNAIRSVSRVFASVVCDDFSPEGKPVGYARDFLPETYTHLDAVLTDTRSFPAQLVRQYGLPRELFFTLYSPIAPLAEPRYRADPGSRRVLWASRLDRQKRPDLLIRIAERLPQYEFHVFGASVIDGVTPRALFQSSPNVFSHGEYDGFAAIPDLGYELFLYTSQWDGLPLVLLDATFYGLPTVASDVGGVGEFISNRTGFLVSPFDDVDGYVAAMQAIAESPDSAQHRWQRALDLARTRHSPAAFERSIQELPAYVTATTEETDLRGGTGAASRKKSDAMDTKGIHQDAR